MIYRAAEPQKLETGNKKLKDVKNSVPADGEKFKISRYG